MLRRLRFRPVGWLAAGGTIAAMAASMVVAAPGGAAGGTKLYEKTFGVECVLAPGILNKKGILTVKSVVTGPATLTPGQEFELVEGSSTLTTPAEWSTTLANLGASEARGFIKAIGVIAENGTPATFNAAKGLHETEFPNGLPYEVPVESGKAMTFTAPSEARHFKFGPYKAGAVGTFRLNVSTVPGFKEISAGHYEPTGEGVQATTEGYNERGEQILSSITVACTAALPTTLLEIPIEGTTTTTTTLPTTTTTTPTTTTTTTTTPVIECDCHILLHNWKLGGSLTDRKQGQPIDLPEACTFNGETTGSASSDFATLEGNTQCPAFAASLRLFGALPITLGLELTESEPVKGTLTFPSSGGELALSATAKDNLAITSLGVLGVTIPTSCKTAEPVVFPLQGTTTSAMSGWTFNGETTLPPIRCGGVLGQLVGLITSALMSGPNNRFTITLAP
jgi:hypothetical protein